MLCVGLMSSTGGLRAANPLELVPTIVGGLIVAGAGYASIESIKAMVEDYNSGKKNDSGLGGDAWNIVKTVGLVSGLSILGAQYDKGNNIFKYVAPCIGSGVVLGGSFLVLKHGCDNKKLRLREFVAVTALAGAGRAVLAPSGLAFSFGS